jgi:hypothetical protein
MSKPKASQTIVPAKENRIKVNILLQQREDGKTIASVLEVPDCTVEESSRERAITSLTANLIQKLKMVEVVSLELPTNEIFNINAALLATQSDPELSNSPNPAWLKSAGIFKTDTQFEDFQQEIQAYRDELDMSNSEYIE